jgi:2-polyprenyl-3-methyl-5-hydroxy-6-metoxy-1,4-benzoquinol methylase
MSTVLPQIERAPQRKHPADWSPETVQRYWNYLRTRKRFRDLYFSRLFGRGIAAFLEHTGRLRGRVLDFGCGPGFLVEHLLASPGVAECWGADSASDSVAEANERLAGARRWRGAHLLGGGDDLPAGHFDAVTCVEVVEHLPDADLAGLLGAVRTLLGSGGTALFTTPFEENLEDSMTYCPFCDAEFHWMQHVRAFSAASLTAVLERAGFTVRFCRDLNFDEFQRPYGKVRTARGFGSAKRVIDDHVCRWKDRLDPRPFPDGRVFQRLLVHGGHLCALAERR